MSVFVLICQKENKDEDIFVEVYCEEVNEPPSAPCSTCRADCQEIVIGGKGQLYAFHYYISKKTQYQVRSVNTTIVYVINITIVISTVTCCHVKATMFNISSESVSQHLDTPVGESESYIVITCREGETVHESTDMNSSKPNNPKPDEQISSQAPEGMEDKKKSQLVFTLTHTSK